MTAQPNVPMLLAWLSEARRAKLAYEKTWARNRQRYAGNHWDKIKKRKSWESRPVINKDFEMVEINRALLADQRWGLDAMPRKVGKGGDEDDGATIAQKAMQVNRLLDYIWDDAKIQYHLSEMMIDLFCTGTGFLKSAFDPEAVRRGSGELVVATVRPESIFPDPDATCVTDAHHIFEVRNVTRRYVETRWPGKLAGGGSYDATVEATKSHGSYDIKNDSVTLIECWYHDPMMEEVAGSEREMDGRTVSDWRARYPDGRYTLLAGNVVLEDKPNPYGIFPYHRFVEIPAPGQFWGGCTLDKVAGIQDNINYLAQVLIDNGVFLSTGVWIIDDEAMLDPSKVPTMGAPGGVVVKRVGREVRRDVGAPLPPHIFEVFRSQIEAYDRIGGLPDVLRGIVPSRQPVQTTLIQQESGELRTRERARRIEDGLASLGAGILDIVRRYWSDTRTFRRVTAGGYLETFEISADDLKDWEFDIIVKPGSTLPMDRMFAMQKALEMRGAGLAIPDEYILSLSGLPGIEEVIAQVGTLPMPNPHDDAMMEGQAEAPLDIEAMTGLDADDGVPPTGEEHLLDEE